MPVTHWAAAWIKQFAALGITSGCGNSNYCPDIAVTGEQLAIFLLRAKYGSTWSPPTYSTFTYNDISASSFKYWIQYMASGMSITDYCMLPNYCPTSSLTRERLAYFIASAFNLPLASSSSPSLARNEGNIDHEVVYLIQKTKDLISLPQTDKAVAEPRQALQAMSMTASFVYDGDGNRVAQTINGVTTYFVGNYYEVTGSSITKYYYAGAQRVAMRKDTIPQNSTLSYLLTDHLNSTSLTTDASGNLLSELRYTAWGEVRYASGNTPTDYTYTGQYANVDDFGLMFYGARWYDPSLNHFTQPDTDVPASQGVQAWDRYAYTNNNPVRYTDPTGHCISDPLSFMVCAMVAGAVIDAVTNIVSQSRETGHVDPREVFDHAVEGAVIGGGVVIAAVAVAAVLPAAPGVAAAACADGDCTNEAIAVGNAVTNASQALSADGDPTNEIAAVTQNVSTAIVPYNTNTAIVPYYPPNDGAAGEIVEAVSTKDEILSRIGPQSGHYLSPQGTPLWARSLPYGAQNLPERLYQVTTPFTYYVSKAAPWFGQLGGGTQYKVLPSVDWLIKNGYLEKLP